MKPNNFPFSEYMLDCARILQREPEYTSDCSIHPLIVLQGLAEEAGDLYRMDRAQSNRLRVHTHTERLIARLEEWRRSLPPSLAESGKVPRVPASKSCPDKTCHSLTYVRLPFRQDQNLRDGSRLSIHTRKTSSARNPKAFERSDLPSVAYCELDQMCRLC